LTQRRGERPEQYHDLIVGLKAKVTRIASRLWATDMAEDLKTRIRKLVADHHRERPLDKGAPINDLRAKSRAAPELFDHALQQLVSSDKLASDGGLIRQPGFSAELSGAEDKLAKVILGDLTAAGAEPPAVAELTQRHGDKVANVLRFLER